MKTQRPNDQLPRQKKYKDTTAAAAAAETMISLKMVLGTDVHLVWHFQRLEQKIKIAKSPAFLVSKQRLTISKGKGRYNSL